MSRLVVSELAEGALATSADVNLSLTRWNAATAAGQIDNTNIKEEGLDRGTFAQHVLNTQRAGATPQLTTSTAFAPGVFPAYMQFDAAATTIGPVTINATDKLLVCYSLRGVDANNSVVETTLMSSTDNVTYAAVRGTLRRRRCRVFASAPRAVASLSAKTLAAVGTPLYFRVQVNGSAAASFDNAVFWVESLAT